MAAVILPDEVLAADFTDFEQSQQYRRGQTDYQKSITITLEVIFISLFIFVALLAWFEWLSDFFRSALTDNDLTSANIRLYYALYVTVICVSLALIVYLLFNR